MILIVGGAYQGKEAFARSLFPDLTWTDGGNCEMEEIFFAQGILHFHEYVRRAMKEKRDLSQLAEQLLSAERLLEEERVIVTDEIGYGIVPMDAFDREYREKTGRICTELASGASKVYRVICGIGTVIKE